MIRKTCCLLVVFAMAISLFAGCSGSDEVPDLSKIISEKDGEKEPSPTPTEKPADVTEAPTPTPTQEPTPEPKPQGKTYGDGQTSPVFGEKEDFDAEALAAEGFTVVDSVEGLLDAIRPGARIVIAPGYYDMSICLDKLWLKASNENKLEVVEYDRVYNYNQWIVISEVNDGVELTIRDIDDLLISGGSEAFIDTRLVVQPRYAAVVRFDRCGNVKIFNVTMGHTDTGDCSGNVIDMMHCSRFGLYNMDIFGCGVYGLGISRGTGDVFAYDCTIRDCSYGALECREGTGEFSFVDCTLTGSPGLFYSPTTESKLTFKNCTFGDGETTAVSFNEAVELDNCTLGNIEYYPEYPDYEGERFDPSGFKAGEMAPVKLEDDPIGEYSEWGGYAAINIVAGTERKMPYYDLTKDQLMSYGISFFVEGETEKGEGKCWLSTGDNFWKCSWSRIITTDNVIIINPEYDEDSEWLTENESGAVFGYLYKDHEGHDWICLELQFDNIWLYRNDEQEYYD